MSQRADHIAALPHFGDALARPKGAGTCAVPWSRLFGSGCLSCLVLASCVAPRDHGISSLHATAAPWEGTDSRDRGPEPTMPAIDRATLPLPVATPVQATARTPATPTAAVAAGTSNSPTSHAQQPAAVPDADERIAPAPFFKAAAPVVTKADTTVAGRTVADTSAGDGARTHNAPSQTIDLAAAGSTLALLGVVLGLPWAATRGRQRRRVVASASTASREAVADASQTPHPQIGRPVHASPSTVGGPAARFLARHNCMPAPGCWPPTMDEVVLELHWGLDVLEQWMWSAWFQVPATDFSDGLVWSDPLPARLAAGTVPARVDGSAADSVPAKRGMRQPDPAPALATATVPEHVPVPAVPAMPAVATPDPAPAPVPAAATAAALPVPAAPSLQSRIDACVGQGMIIADSVADSAAPWLRLGSTALGASAAGALLNAMRELQDTVMSQWMMAQVVLLARFQVGAASPVNAYQVVLASALDAPTDERVTAADWQALQVQLQVAWLERQSAAARAIAFARLRTAVQALSCRDTPIVRRAWLEALLQWAAQSRGGAALARFEEAEAVCRAFEGDAAQAAVGQRLLANTLLQKALVEQGAARRATAMAALVSAVQAHANAADADTALVVAQAALARAGDARREEVMDLLEQALVHAAIASSSPRLAVQAQACRDAVQRLHERCSGTADAVATPSPPSTAGQPARSLHRRP